MKFTATGNQLAMDGTEAVNSGTVNWHRAEFAFDSTWDGLARTAVFHTVYGDWSVLLDGDTCVVPWEALKHRANLSVAVLGVKDSLVLTTNYAPVGQVEQGADREAAAGEEPSPGVYEQIMAAIGDVSAVLDEINGEVV